MENNNRKRRTVLVGLLVGACALPLTAASCTNDAPVKTRDRTGAALMNMPDEFPTVAMKCDGSGHIVYEGDDGSGDRGAMAVISDTRSCPDGYRGAPR